MRKLFPLLALILACCLSCDAPFDLSLSQALLAIRDMKLEATVGPIKGVDKDREGMDIVFLPEKESVAPGIDFQNGFLLMRGSNRANLSYVQFIAADNYQAFGGWGSDFLNPDPHYYPVEFESLKFGSAIAVVGLNPLDPVNNSLQVLNVNFVSRAFDSPGWKNLKDLYINAIGPALPYDANVLGYSIYPSDSPPMFDNSYWLVRMNTAPYLLREVSMNADSATLTNKLDTRTVAFDIPELVGVNRCLYYHDPDVARVSDPEQRKSYASWFDAAAGGWKCVSWKGTASVEYAILPGVTRRIDALLSTGRLFSTEDEVGRVYSETGVEIAAFPLGALRFVGERCVNGAPLVLFSLARTVRENTSDVLSVDIYSIKAVDLEALGK